MLCKVAKGRLKMGFRRPFGVVGKGVVQKDRVLAYRTHTTHEFQVCVIGR
ncbi:hypothetical protein [Neisseria sicca]|nr:hypothetical protein [Neisseria sicca]